MIQLISKKTWVSDMERWRCVPGRAGVEHLRPEWPTRLAGFPIYFEHRVGCVGYGFSKVRADCGYSGERCAAFAVGCCWLHGCSWLECNGMHEEARYRYMLPCPGPAQRRSTAKSSARSV